MFISKKRYLFSVRCINYYKIFSDAYASRIDIDRKKIDELNSKFQHMRQSKIFWKNRCRELEKIANNYGKFAGLTLREFYEQQNQDKISFAVEQLEKVKEEAKHYGYNFSKLMHEFIDNQIDELKGVVN